MYLSFGATLAPIGICYSTLWSVCGPAIINEGVLCLGARKMQRFAQDCCLHTFFCREKGEDHAAPSESLWTLQLQLSRGGFSKLPDTATILQLAVTEQCTNSRRCVWHLHRIHFFQTTLSDPDVSDASAETEDDEEPGKPADSSSDSEGKKSLLK